MRIKLAHKLWIANIGVILALTGVFVNLSYHFSKGMYSHALNGIDIEVMDRLSRKLSDYYREHGSWSGYVHDKSAWEEAVNSTFFATFFELVERAAGPEAPSRHFGALHSGEQKDWEMPFGTFLQRLALLDAKKEMLIVPDMPKTDVGMKAIRLNGKVVGWLSVGKINVDMLPLAGYFFEQQIRIVTWSAAVGGIIAALLSFFLSRHITAPIKKLNAGAQRVAKRNFDTHIDIHTNDELQELAQSFNTLCQELGRYQQRQQQWILDISHEIKLPLTVLVGEIYAVCDNLTKCDDATADYLREEVMHIKRLVDDLYDIYRVEEMGIDLEREIVDLQSLIEPHLVRYKTRFAKRNIELHEDFIQHPAYVLGDRDRLIQVLRNLLENCIRYTTAPGNVWISLTDEHQYRVLTLEDSGPGVPADVLPKLFERLYRGDVSQARFSAGAGLGLAICKIIIEAHGGDISALPGRDGGLCIAIRLPAVSGDVS